MRLVDTNEYAPIVQWQNGGFVTRKHLSDSNWGHQPKTVVLNGCLPYNIYRKREKVTWSGGIMVVQHPAKVSTFTRVRVRFAVAPPIEG